MRETMRAGNKLTAKEVARIKEPGRYQDGLNLMLVVTPSGTKNWLFRYTLDGRTRDMGLGPCHSVNLAEARERAREARNKLAMGIDPLAGKPEQEARAGATFDACAAKFIASHAPTWKNPKHRAQWSATLATYVSPEIGKLAVGQLDTKHILRILEPIWRTKNETACRVRSRVERILDWAKAQGLMEGENPARLKGHLDKLLPSKKLVRKAKHHDALAYVGLPAFMAKLAAKDGVSARALEFTILTAARTGEVIGARWTEIDLKAKLWTCPGVRTKSGRDHRVPLCDRALALLNGLPRESEYIFVNGGNKPLSNMALLSLLKGMQSGITTHGFRSTFSDWARDCTNFPRDVVEHSLAHAVKDKTEGAYRRGDALQKRTLLMAEWSKFATGTPLEGKVLTMQRAKG
jgi:integrase